MKNKKMNRQNKAAYLALTLILTFLVYKQSTGLNMLLISIISIGYLSFTTEAIKNKNWWFSAILWIGSGLSLFLSHPHLGGLLYFLTGFNFISVNYNSNYSFPFSIAHTFFSTMLGIEKFMTPKKSIQTNKDESKVEEKEKNTNYTYLKPIFIYGTPLILVIIFLKLYQLANPKFEEYTQFLSLEFIEWSFIGIYALLSVFLYGIYIYNSHKTSEGWDLNRKNAIDRNYTDSFQTKIGIETEQKMASILLITLNLLLIAFLCIDGITLFSTHIDAELTHSQNVHQGINVLITSILLVILIVGFMYRGSLNFTKNKSNLYLTISWLLLNIIMTVFNSFKNFNYINEWGLTHKRIGVFIYLGLCIIGLTLTLYKVLNTKSFVFLIRRVSFSFVALLVGYSIVNWNHIIITYNLNESHFNTTKIDLHYNYSLGYSTYPELITYLKEHPKADENLLKKLDYKINYIKANVTTNWKDIPSLKWFDYNAKQKLQNYKPLPHNDYKETSLW